MTGKKIILEASTIMLISNGDEYNLEYRSKKDDAWYTCGVVLVDRKHLRVKFKDFADSRFDEVFSIAKFSSLHEVEEMFNRFRPISEPVEDNECSKVIIGMKVSAVYRGKEEVRYFDAIVDDVLYKEHTPENCLCTYLLFWQHGPDGGNITATTLEDICFIMHGAIDPKVTDFTKLVKEKLKTSSDEKSQVCGSVRNSSHVGFSTGRELSDHDNDLGGVEKTKRHHYIVLENLEKDLCPLTMMDFIHEHTSITAQTYVFPSLLIETYARGAIMVDSITKLKKIFEFINDPNHFITSISGRPWVMAEDKLNTGTVNPNLQDLQPKYENYSRKNELKVVHLGTKEYKKSKRLKDSYLEFRNHLNGLSKRLAMEEEEKHGDMFSFCKM